MGKNYFKITQRLKVILLMKVFKIIPANSKRQLAKKNLPLTMDSLLELRRKRLMGIQVSPKAGHHLKRHLLITHLKVYFKSNNQISI